nr:uncharacterized protein LOC111837076 [Paramormyrops kingsleyae]
MAWSTNVGNEHGQVLMSVLTAHEGDGLLPMATGLMRRYREAGVPPPKLLYVDRDCCSSVGKSRAAAMFCEWEELVVRLDVWHLMRRFAVGVTTDSHQLYGLFMETERLIAELLEAFRDVKDTMGIPLLDSQRMDVIWDTQRRHLGCIQDPPGFRLYTETGQLTKGGIVLPTYRCARGSRSLDSFHLHLNRFIPGTANAENFQAYLLEGLVQWNEDRAAAADQPEQVLRCYSGQLQHSLNHLSQELLGLKLVEDYTKPGEYTGELIGVEYLYSQQCLELREDDGHDPDAPDGTPDVLENLEDEDFEEAGPEEEHDPTISSLHFTDGSLPLHSSPAVVAEVPSAHAELPVDPGPSTVPLPKPSLTTATPVPESRQKEPEPAGPPSDLRPFALSSPPDLSGQAAATATPQPQPAPLPPAPAIPAPLPPPAPSQAESPGNLPGLKTLSRTTEWRRRKAAEALAISQGLPIPPRVSHPHYTCTQCGQPRRQQYGHRRFKNTFFCEKAEGMSFEDWKAQYEEPR